MASPLYRTADTAVRLRAVLTSLAIVALAFLAGLVLASLGVSAAAAAGLTTDSAPVVVYGLQYALLSAGFLLVVAGYVELRDDLNVLRYRRPTRRDALWTVAGFLGLIVTSAALGEVIAALGLESAQNQVILTGRDHPLLFLVMVPVTLLFVAPGEELVFRGVVQGQFRRAYGALPAVVIASLLFGVSHSGALSGSGKVTYLLVATVLGLLLGAVYEYTENVLIPVAIHAAWNSLLYLSEWLRVVHGIALGL